MFPGSGGDSRTGKGLGPGWWTDAEDAIVLRDDITLKEMCRLLELHGTPRSYRGVEGRRWKLQKGLNKGRHSDARGELNNSAKLTPDEVLEIRANDLPQTLLARMYGVSQPMISNIKRHRSWRHLPD
jgi:hypothetical protein